MAANSRFAVAVHVLTGLAYSAERGEVWVSSEKLAGSIRTNPVVVRRAVSALARAGLVEAQAGRGGGARLVRDPAEVTLAAVYRAVAGGSEGADGGLAGGVLAPNPNPPNPHCPVSCAVPCALAPVFAAVEDAVDQALGRTTLADVVAQVGPVGVPTIGPA